MRLLQDGWFIGENTINMDDLGVYPYVRKPPNMDVSEQMVPPTHPSHATTLVLKQPR